MNSNPLRAASLSLCLALLGPAANSTPLDFCRNFGPSPGPGIPYQCVAALAFTEDPLGTQLVIAPDRASILAPVTASRTATGGGKYGAVSDASATASPGLLRARSYGNGLAPPVGGYAFASGAAAADASFVDYGTITGLPGALAGDPVNLRLRFDMAGSFAGDGESILQIYVYRNFGVPLVNTHLFTDLRQPSDVGQFDFGFAVGDSIQMFVHLTTQATGLYGRPSRADVSNTAHAYLDVLSGNARFVSSSGHLYGLHDINPLPVPEPASAALLLLGGFVVVGSVWRRTAGPVRRPANPPNLFTPEHARIRV